MNGVLMFVINTLKWSPVGQRAVEFPQYPERGVGHQVLVIFAVTRFDYVRELPLPGERCK
jgi:hypothetical protein